MKKALLLFFGMSIAISCSAMNSQTRKNLAKVNIPECFYMSNSTRITDLPSEFKTLNGTLLPILQQLRDVGVFSENVFSSIVTFPQSKTQGALIGACYCESRREVLYTTVVIKKVCSSGTKNTPKDKFYYDLFFSTFFIDKHFKEVRENTRYEFANEILVYKLLEDSCSDFINQHTASVSSEVQGSNQVKFIEKTEQEQFDEELEDVIDMFPSSISSSVLSNELSSPSMSTKSHLSSSSQSKSSTTFESSPCLGYPYHLSGRITKQS